MKKKSEKPFAPSLENMIKEGTINILAVGYKGIEAWRSKRENIKIPSNEKKD
ncbi:MAG: hypothetical protein LRY27_00845 [Chitinophagales bacterium]|nr:hypothetical protein [Chitinophagales bacterium]